MRRSVLATLVLALALPASASAATLTVSGGSLSFQAARGEANDMDVRDLFDPARGHGLTVTDTGAPLAADPACDAGPPLLCPVGPVLVHLGDRGDHARVVSTDDATSVWGENGNDEILSSGLESLANGGPGDDLVQVNSNSDALAYGGTGNDRIEAGSSFRALAYGQSGNDLIIHEPSVHAILAGGPGNDAVIGLPHAFGGLEAHGGPGTDVLAVQATGGSGAIARWTLSGDDGNDLIAGGPGPDTVSGGAGSDAIYTAGGDADTVSCGSGYDLVRADRSDTLAADCEAVLITSTSSVPSTVTSALRRAR
jgi:Ca2+-binding RTX toxin-like protein